MYNAETEQTAQAVLDLNKELDCVKIENVKLKKDINSLAFMLKPILLTLLERAECDADEEGQQVYREVLINLNTRFKNH